MTQVKTEKKIGCNVVQELRMSGVQKRQPTEWIYQKLTMVVCPLCITIIIIANNKNLHAFFIQEEPLRLIYKFIDIRTNALTNTRAHITFQSSKYIT